MAKRAETTPTQESRIPSDAEFAKLLRKLKAAESEASEAKGRMGSAIENAVADCNLHVDALRVFRKYAKKSPAQCVEFMLHLSTYWEYGTLGEPESDLVESPKERRKRMTKPQIAAIEEKMGIGTKAIRGATIVDLHEPPEAA